MNIFHGGYWRDLFDNIWNKTWGKIRPAHQGKHQAGRAKPHDWRAKLQARRKAERQQRRAVRLQAAGKKHRA